MEHSSKLLVLILFSTVSHCFSQVPVFYYSNAGFEKECSRTAELVDRGFRRSLTKVKDDESKPFFTANPIPILTTLENIEFENYLKGADYIVWCDLKKEYSKTRIQLYVYPVSKLKRKTDVIESNSIAPSFFTFTFSDEELKIDMWTQWVVDELIYFQRHYSDKKVMKSALIYLKFTPAQGSQNKLSPDEMAELKKELVSFFRRNPLLVSKFYVAYLEDAPSVECCIVTNDLSLNGKEVLSIHAHLNGRGSLLPENDRLECKKREMCDEPFKKAYSEKVINGLKGKGIIRSN